MTETSVESVSYLSTAIAGIFFAIGVFWGLKQGFRKENAGIRYWKFYSILFALAGIGLLLSSIPFYFRFLNFPIYLYTTSIALVVAAGWFWICRKANGGNLIAFITISVIPGLTLWLIPLTVWNIYYATKQKSNKAVLDNAG